MTRLPQWSALHRTGGGTRARANGDYVSERKGRFGFRRASFSDIVRLNTFIVDIGTNIAHYREVRDKFVNTSAPPASTAIGVPQLARPGALFEVEAIAVLPPT